MTRLSIISTANPKTVRQIMTRMEKDSELRVRVFKEVSQNVTLQRKMLSALAARPDAQKEFLRELTRKPQLRRLILKIADHNT